MTHIDKKTTIPLEWVLAGAFTGGSAILVGVVAGCMWVFTVNARLSRIELHLGIDEPVASCGFINNADAGMTRKKMSEK